MLGITVADSVLVGTLILAVLAAWQGKKDGATAAKAAPSSDGTKELAEAVKDLAEAIRDGIQAQHGAVQRETAELLKQVSSRLERPR
ncbi:hypothetical protein Xaut_3729 [Xanthobacter versatilis]|uniref:Uncharacterized protein n=1 Tax=Xanthobacter autotrophicus (strain ATCC BAA-1158 / Py2) TaxID=78245 RepID=A7ILR2_XANP2|nr:hypothetical protein Xaut_3729 [Xanthobacter autotrophicus Py2]